MHTERKRLDRAEERIADEQSFLRAECEAFEEFRDTVSLAKTTAGTDPASATGMERLREAYRETVMSSPDFEGEYGESPPESLENEFSSSVANALLLEDRITQRLRRDLLVGTNEAIERREQVRDALDAEREGRESRGGDHRHRTDAGGNPRPLAPDPAVRGVRRDVGDLRGADDPL